MGNFITVSHKFEGNGDRSLAYSLWHRTLSHRCYAIDIDFVEYCRSCREPIMIYEVALDNGVDSKSFSMTKAIANSMCVPAYVVLYTPNKRVANFDGCQWNKFVKNIDDWTTNSDLITKLRIKQIAGNHVNTEYVEYTEQEWRKFLEHAHRTGQCEFGHREDWHL
jgi:hypothetical protein